MKMKFVLLAAALVAAVFLPAAVTVAQSPNSQQTLNQYVTDLQKSPNNTALREKIIKLAQQVEPIIPKEANRHYIRAGVFAQQAENPADIDAAINEYQQALALAPWWGDAYYKLALALITAERFDEATTNLQLCLLTNPEAKIAAEVQNQIYTIEVQKERTAKRNAEAAAATEKQQQDEEQARSTELLAAQNRQAALNGPWTCSGFCTGATLSVTENTFGGTVIVPMSGDISSLAVSISGSIKDGVAEGQAIYPGFSMGPCEAPGRAQSITGTLSTDGRSLELKTFFTAFHAQWQGLLFSTCVSIDEAGTTPNFWNFTSSAPIVTPMLAAINSQSIEAVKLALAHGADINAVVTFNGGTALHLAAAMGNDSLVAFLLDHGASVDAKDNRGYTPLSGADAKSALLLLDHGANPILVGADNMSPERLVAQLGNVPMMTLLLKYAKLDSYTLCFALKPENLGMVNFLLANGADSNVRCSLGETPLYDVAWSGSVETMMMLLEHGAKVDIPDNGGVYPIMEAAQAGSLNKVKVLIAHGADINVKDSKGKSVLWYAKEGRGTELGWSGYKRSEANKETVEFLKGLGLKK
jgi:ankyrin repeat protein